MRFGSVWRGLVLWGEAWHGEVGLGLVRRGTVWRGSVGHGLVWSGLVFCEVTNDYVVEERMAQMDVGHRTRKDASTAA